MYRWINIWLNVVEHVIIEYTGMMSGLFPALELKKYNTVQYEVMGRHQSLDHRVQQIVFTGVTDSRSLCIDKLHFSLLWHLQRCVEQPDVQPHLIRSKKACGAAGRVIHWISTEE